MSTSQKEQGKAQQQPRGETRNHEHERKVNGEAGSQYLVSPRHYIANYYFAKCEAYGRRTA